MTAATRAITARACNAFVAKLLESGMDLAGIKAVMMHHSVKFKVEKCASYIAWNKAQKEVKQSATALLLKGAGFTLNNLFKAVKNGKRIATANDAVAMLREAAQKNGRDVSAADAKRVNAAIRKMAKEKGVILKSMCGRPKKVVQTVSA